MLQTLSNCERISDEGLRYLCSSYAGQTQLRELELDNCKLITDNSIEFLVLVTS